MDEYEKHQLTNIFYYDKIQSCAVKRGRKPTQVKCCLFMSQLKTIVIGLTQLIAIHKKEEERIWKKKKTY